jgi:hypothetical protein
MTFDISELRRLHQAASELPWAWRAINRRCSIGNRLDWVVTDLGELDTADAELIVAAVNALPALLDRLEAAEAKVTRVEAVVGKLPEERPEYVTTYPDDIGWHDNYDDIAAACFEKGAEFGDYDVRDQLRQALQGADDE